MFVGELLPFQVKALERMVERKTLLLAFHQGLGKLNPVSEPVLTPDGWATMGELKVGDFVIGGDGLPTEVMGVYPQGVQEIVCVSFQDGSWSRCGWDHVWAVNTSWRNRTGLPHKLLTTSVIDAMGLRYANGDKKFRIPVVSPVEYGNTASLPIDPYSLGVLMGDGSFVKGKTRATTDQEIVSAIGWRGKDDGHKSIGIVDWKLDEPELEAKLNALGCRGHRSWEKAIPGEYMVASAAERLALLQGLMDTDGGAHEDGGAEFSSTSLNLFESVLELVESLGGIASGIIKCSSVFTYKGERRKGRPAWRAHVKLPAGSLMFRLTRKAVLYKEPTKYPPCRVMSEIKPDGREEAVCIRVANPDGLYVTRHHIVTHNTVATIAVCEELLDGNEVEQVLIVVPATLKYQWEKEIGKFTEGEALVQVIAGTPPVRARQYQRARSVDYVIVNYEQVVNDWKQVRKVNAGAVVIDEVQAIKSMSSKRSRVIKRLRPEYRFGLSGQPVESRPEEAFSIMEWIDPDVFGRPATFDKAFIKRDSWGNVKHYKNLPTFHKRLSMVMERKRRDDPDVVKQLPRTFPPQVVTPEFDPPGARLYRRIVAELRNDLLALQEKGFGFDVEAHYRGETPGSAEQGLVGSKIACLRMLCDHPELLRLSAKKFDSGSKEGGSKYASDLLHHGLLDGLRRAPKLSAVVEVVRDILAEDPKNKIVLFSYFKATLGILKAETKALSDSAIFSGDQNGVERERAKTKFQTDPRTRLFLSSDAGGVGVDLPQANFVIHYDIPWSAGQYDQRSSRIIRLSSKFKAVSTLTFLMSGSIEERYHDVLMQKRTIGEAFVDGRKVDREGKLNLDVATLGTFLKQSAV